MKRSKFNRKWKATEKPTEQSKAVSKWLESVNDKTKEDECK
jgi:hypothetical protein